MDIKGLIGNEGIFQDATFITADSGHNATMNRATRVHSFEIRDECGIKE